MWLFASNWAVCARSRSASFASAVLVAVLWESMTINLVRSQLIHTVLLVGLRLMRRRLTLLRLLTVDGRLLLQMLSLSLLFHEVIGVLVDLLRLLALTLALCFHMHFEGVLAVNNGVELCW